jgi:nicotinamide-nucleotide amidase
VTDTNSTYVANRLFENGFRLYRTQVILDDVSQIISTLEKFDEKTNIVICFGGLGPTSDDKTCDAICAFLKCKTQEHPAARKKLEDFLAHRKRELTAEGLKQVRFPEKCQPVLNPVGLAVGFCFERKGCWFVFLPGVPIEMKAMFEASVLPEIIHRLGEKKITSHSWRCLGIPEAELQRRMNEIEKELPVSYWTGYRTRYPENHFVLYSTDTNSENFENYRARIHKEIEDVTYTEGTLELEEIVLDLLKKQNKTIAFAESCTGGLGAQRLTRIAGSSLLVWGGYACYQAEAKNKMLGVRVSPEAAVSSECSRRLADSLLEISGCSVVASITGYMGPSGGTEADPNGTFYICVKNRERQAERRIFLPGMTRELTQWGAATHLLNEIRRFLS